MADNKMKEIRVEKVTVNMGVGEKGEELKKATTILQIVTGAKPTLTKCKVKQPDWGLRPGLTIGTKVTLRGKKAETFLVSALMAKDKKIKKKSFDKQGNFGFGIREYIDLPKAKYDPKLGIKGFDVLVTLERPGYRIKRRKIGKAKVFHSHLIQQNDAIDFVKKKFGVEVE
ncbi:MAG: 50S ribosomal protein L5 [archaeon]|nr:50S ribosomal protein L5 [archaeon]